MRVATSSTIPRNTRAALWSRTTFCPAVTSFAARGRTNTFCHTRLQTRIAGASHQTDHRAARTFRAAPNVTFFFGVKLCTRYSMVHILPTSSSKSVLNASFVFNISKCKLSSRYCPVHFLSTTFIEARTRRNRVYPKKTQGFAHESVFTLEFTRSGIVPLLYMLLPHANCSWLLLDDDMRTWWQDCPWTFVSNFEVPIDVRTKLPLIMLYIYIFILNICEHCICR